MKSGFAFRPGPKGGTERDLVVPPSKFQAIEKREQVLCNDVLPAILARTAMHGLATAVIAAVDK